MEKEKGLILAQCEISWLCVATGVLASVKENVPLTSHPGSSCRLGGCLSPARPPRRAAPAAGPVPLRIYGRGPLFILSGFILTSAHPALRPSDARRFLTKRAARVLPLHWAVIISWPGACCPPPPSVSRSTRTDTTTGALFPPPSSWSKSSIPAQAHGMVRRGAWRSKRSATP